MLTQLADFLQVQPMTAATENIAKPVVLISGPEAPTRSVSIAETLRGAILAGQFQPGERLYEVTLSETLNVSRTPIRAALQSLAGEGLLHHIPNRGYYVRGFSIEEIVQAYEIRAALEGLAAKRAAQRGLAQEDRAVIEGALRDGDALLQKGSLSPADRVAYGEVNAAFHSAIHNAGQSRMLRDMLRMSQQVAPSSHRNVIAFEHHDVRRRHDDHHRIYETILEGDTGRAELLMRDHVERVKTSLIRSLSPDA
jgi:GntR family transcriptional regulator of vanillate catabolism